MDDRTPREPVAPALDVATLTGRFVRLELLHSDLVGEIALAAGGDRSSFALTQVPDGTDEAAAYVRWLLDDAGATRAVPFAQRRLADGALVGCTRFMNPAWPLGRGAPDEIEIGGTWLAASAQRTAINTDAKLLLLGHAFDVWQVQRVAICTDARNAASRRAIERIGATFEGILRRHRRSAHASDLPPLSGPPRLRDSATYSITTDEWPRVREQLQRRLDVDDYTAPHDSL